MAEVKNYCMGCMKPIAPGTNVCARCYYDSATVQKAPFLPKGTAINEKYLLGKIIATANDCVTYIGLNRHTETVVKVCEFLPAKIITRHKDETAVSIKKNYEGMYANCLNSFIALWNGLKTKNLSCLPRVIEIIECNNTAYAICENIDCISLKNYFEQSGKTLSWSKTYSAFKPVIKAFGELHADSIVHGGISPSTISVGSDGKLHVTGFSIPQCHSPVPELTASPVDGFSPLELYEENPCAKPESDIYSLLSVMFYCCTGTVPPSALERAENDNMMVPADLVISDRNLEGLFSGLCVYPEDRCTLVDHLLNELAPEKTQKAQAKQGKAQPQSAKKNTAKAKAPAKKNVQTAKQKKDDEKSYLFSLAIRTFSAVVFICAILFCTLYTTVLYKNYSIPVLDNAFSWASFLPINKDAQNKNNSEAVNAESSTSQSINTSNNKSYVTVIDFTKLSYDEIKNSEIYNRNFTIEYVFEASDTIPENTVMSQDLTVGESVLQGTTVKLVISSGVEDVEVPLVIGMDFAKAKRKLAKAGLKAAKQVVENPGGNTENEVCDANVVAGISVKKGTKIVLSVWDDDPDAAKTESTDADSVKTQDEKKTSSVESSETKSDN